MTGPSAHNQLDPDSVPKCPSDFSPVFCALCQAAYGWLTECKLQAMNIITVISFFMVIAVFIKWFPLVGAAAFSVSPLGGSRAQPRAPGACGCCPVHSSHLWVLSPSDA